MLNSSNEYRLSMKIGTLLLPAHCNLLYERSLNDQSVLGLSVNVH